MDPALLNNLNAFKKRALSQPAVEARPKKSSAAPGEGSGKPKSSKRAKIEQTKPKAEFDYKMGSSVSHTNFALLAKVVKFLRTRHQEAATDALTIDEIMEEAELVLNARQRHWLSTEALMNNPKIEVVDGNTFRFKPIYHIRDRKGLLALLRQHDEQGMGGVLAEEVEESLPNYSKAIKALGDQLVIIARPIDKKQVLFYNDKAASFTVDEEIQKLWRSVTVEGVDERKIEEYLEKHNIVAMQDISVRKVSTAKRKGGGGGKKKLKPFKTHNEHLGNLLQDYSEKQRQPDTR